MTGHAQGLMNSYMHNVYEYQIDFFVYVGLDKRILMKMFVGMGVLIAFAQAWQQY